MRYLVTDKRAIYQPQIVHASSAADAIDRAIPGMLGCPATAVLPQVVEAIKRDLTVTSIDED